MASDKMNARAGSGRRFGSGRWSVVLGFILMIAPLELRAEFFCDLSWDPEIGSSPLTSRFVLGTAPTSPGSPIRYELSIAPCGAKLCPVEVRLLHGPTLLDRTRIYECSVAEEPQPRARGTLWGVGDPSQAETSFPIWETGSSGFQLSFTARAAQISRGLNGFLVHVRAGWEEPTTEHYLFVMRGKKLVLAWRPVTRYCCMVTWVDVADVDGDGAEELLRFDLNPLEDTVDDELIASAAASVLKWDAEAFEIREISVSRAGTAILASLAGTFESVTAAAVVRDQLQSCYRDAYDSCVEKFEGTDRSEARAADVWSFCEAELEYRENFRIVPTDPFPQFERGKFLLAVFTWRRDLAAKQLTVLKSCRPHGRGYPAELMFFPMPGRP